MHLFFVCLTSMTGSTLCRVDSRTSISDVKMLKYFYTSWEIALAWESYPTFHALEVRDPLPETSRSRNDPANNRKMNGTAEGLLDPN